MDDDQKTKKQLKNELAQALKRVAELEQYVALHEQTQGNLKKKPIIIASSPESPDHDGQADKMLSQSEDKFAEAFMRNSVPMAISTVKEGRYIDVSDAFLNLMGLPRDEVVGNTSTGVGFITLEQRSTVLNQLKKKGRVENLELQMKTKGGELRFGLFNSTLITIGNEDYLLTVVTDITERKHAENALKENEERYRGIYENAPFGIFHSTLEGKIIDVNPMFAQIFGYDSPEEIISLVNRSSVAELLYEEPG
ncbi:MAG TPA: PAS domain-containing protein, partial [Desulfomonilia bacterium]|nr:PAS domain-containing protein [Desulfomonilia bacterium]